MKLQKYVIAICLAGSLYAQRADMKGTFSGKVMAPDGTAVAAAAVTVSDSAGHVRTAKSGPDGLFSVNDVPEGTYRVEIAVPGYKKLTKSDIQVTDGSPLNIKFDLQKEPKSGWRRLFGARSK